MNLLTLIRLRNKFEKESLLLLPDGESRSAEWVAPSCCRWDAPPVMTTLKPTKHLFKGILAPRDTERVMLAQFLRTTLQIGLCDRNDLINELKYLKNQGGTTLDTAIQIYRRLAKSMGHGQSGHLQELK
jgi:hypothetical protein